VDAKPDNEGRSSAPTALAYAAVVWRHLKPFALHPWQLRQVAQRIYLRLKTDGVRALTQQLRDRARAVTDYQRWIQSYDTLSESDRAAIRHHITQLAYQPLISVVMPTYNTPERWLRLAIESVRRQLYPHWELCIADDASPQPHVQRVLEEYKARDSRISVVLRERNGHISAASNSALELARGEFIALLDHDDELSEHALYLVAVELNTHQEADVIYSDEDKIDEHGQRYGPYFKPDRNPDLFTCQNFVSHLGVYRTCRIREIGGFRPGYEGSQDWDLAMRITEQIPPAHIRHIPHVLYHWRASVRSTALAMNLKSYAKDAQEKLLAAHFQRMGIRVSLLPVANVHWQVKYPLPQPPPPVSLIIVSRGQADVLRRCITSLYQKTTYPSFELIFVAHPEENQQTLNFLHHLTKERQVTVVDAAGTDNEAALQNLGAQRAHGEVIALLADNLEVITPDWLEEMVSHTLRPEVGAVGAMLYHPNDTIYHAGIILGGKGGASHAYANRPRGYPGQIGRALLRQNVSAVSVACVALRRKLFEEAGGLDETLLPLVYRSVDFCLRLRERGYRNVWTPHAELYYHKPTKQGGKNIAAEQKQLTQALAVLQQRWGMLLSCDPAYNPNLALDGELFTLAFPPRRQKPWIEGGAKGLSSHVVSLLSSLGGRGE
jgi:glycosyltransferase involved in cell wall biosynthesis